MDAPCEQRVEYYIESADARICQALLSSKNISRKGPRNCRSLHGTPHGEPGQAGQVGSPEFPSGVGVPFRTAAFSLEKNLLRGCRGAEKQKICVPNEHREKFGLIVF